MGIIKYNWNQQNNTATNMMIQTRLTIRLILLISLPIKSYLMTNLIDKICRLHKINLIKIYGPKKFNMISILSHDFHIKII